MLMLLELQIISSTNVQKDTIVLQVQQIDSPIHALQEHLEI